MKNYLKSVIVAGNSYTCDLNQILKLDSVKNKSTEEIVDIWNTFHSVLPSSVSMAMNQVKKKLFLSRLKAHPLFIQPVVRDLRYFFLISYLNTENKFIYFSRLKENKLNYHETEPEFVLRIFTELSVTKQINLIRGDITQKAISRYEAELLMRGLVSFYVDEDLYHNFTVPFNDDFQKFDHDDFVEEYFFRFKRSEDK